MTELTKLSVEEIEALEVIELPDREALTGLSVDLDVCIDVDVDVNVRIGGDCKDSDPCK